MWGMKKINCDAAFIRSYYISCTKFGQLILGKIIIAKRL